MRSSLGPFGGREAALVALKKAGPKQGNPAYSNRCGGVQDGKSWHKGRAKPYSLGECGQGSKSLHSAGDFAHRPATIIAIIESHRRRTHVSVDRFSEAIRA